MSKNHLELILIIFCALWSIQARRYGLFSVDDKPLELLILRSKAVVEGPYAEIEYSQVYKNPYDKPLETEFYFPRTESSIFYKFEAVFKNQTVVGQILEKEQAKAKYEWNLERGNTVAYAEKNALTPDVMQIKVGNIPPHESVEIIFSVIQPLEVIINKYWGFTLPSVLTERYAPASVDMRNAAKINNVNLDSSLYNEWLVSIEVKSDQPFSYIFNPSHNFQPQLSESPNGANSKIYKAVWNVTIVPNKNFVVYFKPEKLEEPTIIAATHPTYANDHVLLVNFVPQLNELESAIAEKNLERGEEGFLALKKIILNKDIESVKAEFIFVIDRSGSMDGNRIENLKKAITKFLQILPKDSLFNIVSFGFSFSFYSQESLRSTQANLGKAMKWVSSISADMGGTEILPALQAVTSIPQIQGYPRNLMILTDGDVFNPQEVISHVGKNADKMRFCTVGIGHGASEYLVKNIAKAGKCTSEFVLDDEDIGDKAEYMIKAATSHYLEDINFKIGCVNEKGEKVYQQEEKVGLLLKDHPFKKWVYLQDIPDIQTCKVRIDYFNSFKNQKSFKEFAVNEFKLAEITDVWHKIAYDDKIKQLDLLVKSENDVESLKSQAVGLSIKYQVLSDYTSFLAVIQESTVNPHEGKTKILVPNLDSADYYSSTRQPSTSYHHKSADSPLLIVPGVSFVIQSLRSFGSLEIAKFAFDKDDFVISSSVLPLVNQAYEAAKESLFPKVIYLGAGCVLAFVIMMLSRRNKKSRIEIKRNLEFKTK